MFRRRRFPRRRFSRVKRRGPDLVPLSFQFINQTLSDAADNANPQLLGAFVPDSLSGWSQAENLPAQSVTRGIRFYGAKFWYQFNTEGPGSASPSTVFAEIRCAWFILPVQPGSSGALAYVPNLFSTADQIAEGCLWRAQHFISRVNPNTVGPSQETVHDPVIIKTRRNVAENQAIAFIAQAVPFPLPSEGDDAPDYSFSLYGYAALRNWS